MENIKVLELFAGSRSIGSVADKMGYTVFSSDINDFDKINYVTDILEFDVSKVPFVPDFIWASPPCTFFSVASIGHHWSREIIGEKAIHTPKSSNAMLGVEIVEKTLFIIRHFLKLNPNLVWFIENPRGKLRKLNVMLDLPRTTIMYCQYGDTRMKPTDVWSNNIYSLFNQYGFMPKTCYAGNKKCHHEEAPRGSKTGTQGLSNAYERSKLPEQLCIEIIKSVINQKTNKHGNS
jgi:hypothetical protein